jgi:cytosine/adenosine deaminase-related metal-dependent hydrolase
LIRYLTADYIFPISSPPIKNGIIIVDDNEAIQDITEPGSRNPELEIYNGIICPGFINTHCHLELSYMKGAIPEKLGMAGFIQNMLAKRPGHAHEQILKAITAAEQEMINNGIVAVGDISNDDTTFEQKSKSNLKYHTFFEVFDVNPSRADEVFEKALTLQTNLKSQISNLKSSITPHAPYTVSKKLFKLIRDRAQQNNSIISYHNEESLAESELFISKKGPIADLFTNMGINLDHIPETGLNSLRSTLVNFSRNNKTLLVHNTYTSKEYILWAINYFKDESDKISDLKSQISNLFWCFCPNANLYIENNLPDYQSFIDAGAICTIGTDSLASNHSLSVLDELKVITKHSPQISLQTLLTWATLNGASFLGFDKELGSIEKGKSPGLNLITDVDLNTLRITPDSKIKKLL